MTHFRPSSIFGGLKPNHFGHLSDADRKALRKMIARIAEKSYRRGFTHGWDFHRDGEEVCDLLKWRFLTGCDTAIDPRDVYHSTAESRLEMECHLYEVGLNRVGDDEGRMNISSIKKLFPSRRRQR